MHFAGASAFLTESSPDVARYAPRIVRTPPQITKSSPTKIMTKEIMRLVSKGSPFTRGFLASYVAAPTLITTPRITRMGFVVQTLPQVHPLAAWSPVTI